MLGIHNYLHVHVRLGIDAKDSKGIKRVDTAL